MTQKTIHQMIEESNQKIKQSGHFTFDWKTWGGSSSSFGFYYGIVTHTKGYTKCAFCKKTFSLDVYNEDENEYSDCPMNPNKNLANNIDENGFGITTWSNCYICGKALSSKSAMLRGICSGCGCLYNSKLDIKLDKKNKFSVLSKLPKKGKGRDLPVLSCVFVKVEDGKMVCKMFKEYFCKTNYKLVEFEIPGVSGKCEINVPRTTFVDTIQIIAEQGLNFSVDEDVESATMIIFAENSKFKIKGIDKDEFHSLF